MDELIMEERRKKVKALYSLKGCWHWMISISSLFSWGMNWSR